MEKWLGFELNFNSFTAKYEAAYKKRVTFVWKGDGPFSKVIPTSNLIWQ
jgi:hypothetical protein